MISHLERFVERYGRLPTEIDPDYLEMVRMSKYRLLTIPDVGLNTKCANCGSAKEDGRGYVDFGLDVDWYGPVYLCGLCVKDIAKAMGLFDNLEKRVEELKLLLAEQVEMSLKEDRLHETVVRTAEEIKEFYGKLSVNRESDGESSPDSSTGMGTDSSVSPDTASTKSKSGITKPNSSVGRTELPSLTELLQNNSKS